jgi:hypothetical protein
MSRTGYSTPASSIKGPPGAVGQPWGHDDLLAMNMAGSWEVPTWVRSRQRANMDDGQSFVKL